MSSEALAVALISCLPRGMAVVSVGLMRGAIVEAMAERRPDLRVVDLVSEPALVAHPALAPVALEASADGAVAAAEGECRATPQRRLGLGLVVARPAVGRLADLGRVLAGLRNVALLWLAPVPGHGALLRHVLPVMRDRGIMVWWTVGADDTAEVPGAAAAKELAVYRFDADGLPLPEGAGGAVATVLLVPRAAWTPHGLDRIAAKSVAVGPLVVPATRGYATALLDQLPAVLVPQSAGPARDKRFVSVGTHVLADAGEIVEHDDEPYLRIGRRRAVTLVVLPPFAGICDAGIVIGDMIATEHAAALRIEAAGVEAAVVLVKEWSQLRVVLPLRLDPALGPVTLTLRDLRPGGAGQAPILIKGIEFAVRPGAGVAFLEPHPLLPSSAPRRLAS